jgi:hypothetical protein
MIAVEIVTDALIPAPRLVEVYFCHRFKDMFFAVLKGAVFVVTSGNMKYEKL